MQTSNIRLNEKLALYCGDGIIPIFRKNLKQSKNINFDNDIIKIISGSMKNAFPQTVQTISSKHWELIISDFYLTHNYKSFHFLTLPYDFYIFATESNYENKLSLPFLNDLMYYEWIVLDTKISFQNIQKNKYSESGDFMNDIIIISPNHHIIQLTYPIHKYTPNESINQQGIYNLLIYTNQNNGQVKTIEMSDKEAYILGMIDTHKKDINTIIQELADDNQDYNYFKNIKEIKLFFNILYEYGIVLGYKK